MKLQEQKQAIIEDAVSEKKKWVRLTYLCNNNCLFCLDGDKSNKPVISEDEIKAEIDNGIKEGATRLVLSGGDPTIHPKLIDFIKYGKEKGYKKIQIITNGRMLAYNSFVNVLADAGLDEVTFSIHGHTSELHDGLTGSQGSFSQSIMGIKNALAKGLIVNTDTVITKINYKYLPEIIRFVHSLGVNEVNLMNIVAFGNAWKNKNIVLYNFEEIMPYVKEVINFCEKNNIFLWFSRFPAEFLEGHEKYIESYKKILEETLARGEEFFRKTPECKGERCKYCGINTVCEDIVSAMGGLKIAEKPAKCITFPKDDEIRLEEGVSFEKLAENICKNAKVKRLGCKYCEFNDKCGGVPREYVREHGFFEVTCDKHKEIKVNMHCNQDCLFCNTNENLENIFLNSEKAIQKLKGWSERGIDYLTISGKEPTVSSNLTTIIEAAKKYGFKKIELQTNAVLCNDDFVEKLKYVGLTNAIVSFHSIDSESYEKTTQSKGTFEKSISGIKSFLNKGIEVTLNLVITKLNYKQLPDMVEYIKNNFNGASVIFSFVAPIRKEYNLFTVPKISLVVPYLKKALDYCKENKINAKIPARYGIPICFLEEYADYFDNSWERYRWEGNCDKVKMPECNECRFYDLCDGLWDEYVKMFGFSEMIVDKHREIRINMDCNMDCLFCNTDNHSENVFLDLKKSVQELIRWHEQGVDYLTISGKEPTLSKDLIPLIKTAKKCGFKKIELQTNAVLCNDDFVEKLKIAGLTSAFISFHSANKDSYEKITQSKETFEKIVNGINCFLNKGIEVTLNIVINELNYKDVPITVKYIHNSFRGINSIVFSFVAPVCNALNNKWIIPKISLVVPYLKKALDYCKENKINAKIPARCGIPIHFLREYADYFDNFRERNRWINSKDKIKTPECNKCEFYDFCDGFWEEYVKIHGFK